MNVLQEAVTALLSMNSPSYAIRQVEPSVVAFEVSTVKTKRGKILVPFIYNIELELNVKLDESSKTYSFSGKSYERTTFSVSTETFKGVYRRKEWGKHLTHDGIKTVKFDTGAIFDEIEGVLRSLGWSRR